MSLIETTWRDTGFGGYINGSFQRLVTGATVMRNGSFVSLFLRLPGEGKPRAFLMLADDLRKAIDGSHGETTIVRLEMDAEMDVAIRELCRSRVSSECNSQNGQIHNVSE